MKYKKKIEDAGEGNIFWITMTDLMTGLVLVFVVMFFYTYLNSHQEKMTQMIAQENATKSIQEALVKQNIDATVDPISGVVKI